MPEKENPYRKLQLQCPLPKLDFDIITLGHGSGGLLTNRLLEQLIFKILDNKWLNNPHDGTLLETSTKTAMTTDSFVISPVFFPGGNIGELAVNGTVNDLAMCGAIPQYLSLSFIIEEGLPVKELWEILLAVKLACEQANVAIVTGDTKIVEQGKGDKIFINTTGIGAVHPKAKINASRIQAGDKIIVSGPVATHGMAIMSVRKGLEFETDLESDTAALHEMTLGLLDKFGEAILFFRDPTRGGLASVLNETAKASGLGIELQEAAIPILEQAKSACEMLGLDPLYVANEGIFIAVVKAEIADEVVAFLNNFDKGKQAASIGVLKKEHPGNVLLKNKPGGRRVLNLAIGEQLPRIC